MKTIQHIKKKLSILSLFLLLSIISFSVSADSVTECVGLNTPNTIYTLTQDVNSIGTCFTITAENITLDCQGYKINYSSGGIEGYGIYSNTFNTTVKNCIITDGLGNTSNSYAIYFASASNGIINNNTITTSGIAGFGIRLDAAVYNVILSNTITTTNDHSRGIYLSASSSFNGISDNTITTSGIAGFGIRLDAAVYNVILSNTITTTNDYSCGIYLSASSTNILSNNIITTSGNIDGTSHGIYLETSSESNIVNSNTITTLGRDAYGIALYLNSDLNNLSNNNITTSGYNNFGIFLSSSSDDNVLSNIITTSDSVADGIRLVESSTNILSNNNITTSGNADGISLIQYWEEVLGYNIVSGNIVTVFSGYSIKIYGSNNNLIYNNLLNSSQVSIGSSINNYFNISKQLGTRIYSSGTEIGGNYWTNPTGDGYSDTCADLDTDGFCDLAYDVEANSSCIPDDTCGNNTDFLPYSDDYSPIIPITECGVLNISNTIYTLTQDVNSIVTCFAITAENITLDCQGYKINYSSNGESNVYGIYSEYDNTSVKNCVIVEGLSNSSNNYAVYYNGVDNGVIYNNIITTSGNNGHGIVLLSSSINTVSNNTITPFGNDSRGIYAYGSSSFNGISDNTVTISGYGSLVGIYLSEGDNNIVEKNFITITSSGDWSYAIECDSGSNNNIFSLNTITTSSNNGGGFIFYNSLNNTISSNSIITSGNSSFYSFGFNDANGSLIYNNLVNSTSISPNLESVIEFWNTTKQLGSRIYSDGIYIGGNYWTNPTGDGYSDTCADLDTDGFCDLAYDVEANSSCIPDDTCGNNTDFLPYSDEYNCTPSITNTSWSEWTNLTCLEDDTMNQSRYLTEYDQNYCGEVSNITYYEYQNIEVCDYCTPEITNTSWSEWTNLTCLEDDTMNQSRYLTEYDLNYCGEVSNITYYEYQNIEVCDYCTPEITNTSWSEWTNLTCLEDDTMNQSRYLTEYDSNYCGEISNITYYEYQNIEVCDYCTPSITNTSWSDWTNLTCLEDDTMNQSRYLTEYDQNYCGEVSNITYYEYQNIEVCDYCTPEITNTSWSDWTNLTCLEDDTMNQSRYLTEYDENYCGEISNITYYEYQNIEYCDHCLSYECIDFGDCQPDITGGYKNCTEVNETLECVYSGDYSEFKEWCDYCLVEEEPIYGSCVNNLRLTTYVLTNNEECCVVTGNESDCSVSNTLNSSCGYFKKYNNTDFKNIVVDGMGTAGASVVSWTDFVILLIIVIFIVGSIIGLGKLVKK